ncbi:PspA/IM30 family protein [Prochlorococcus sp. MIT 1011]|uniref:PspA/IM30 family protein n=1 Tax=Prochlorococcus sp. MIT 1011 TaxID=3082520 RepID=UPI0039B58360
MGLLDRLSRLVRANLNAFVSDAEDPIKILDQSVADMQEDLVKLRQAVAIAIASQKRLENQANQAKEQIQNWFSRAELALKKGEDDLAREALSRKKTFQETFEALTTQFQSQNGQVEKLKKSLLLLERKIAEARTKKDMLKARAQAAKAQQKIQSAVGDLGGKSAMAAFERMEDKVEALEASGQAALELAGEDIESKFAALEGGDDIEKELETLRSQLKSGVEAIALPPSDLDVNEVKTVEIQEVEVELEEMKKSMDNS